MKIVYFCDFCGTSFFKKEDCEACEKSHVKHGEILEEKFYTKNSTIPDDVRIKYGDRIGKYVLDHIIS